MSKPLPGDADGLARESAADEIDAPSALAHLAVVDLTSTVDGVEREAAHVIESLHVGPVLGEDALAERVDLDLPAAPPARALKPEVKPPDPGEETAERRRVIHAPLRFGVSTRAPRATYGAPAAPVGPPAAS